MLQFGMEIWPNRTHSYSTPFNPHPSLASYVFIFSTLCTFPFLRTHTHTYNQERDESVLVAAHTSAGKTVVAEYAIAKALKQNQRVIYTSPIKALSNQKYRELAAEFTDVGLMTGDVVINPSASCIVMTTEILRAMLYRGADLEKEVACVIFDEIHYMKDRERGVVWEEVIICMPKAARMVFLSATLPNSYEFAEWIASVHGTPCHVVSTDYRPTPLVHYAFPLGGSGIYLLKDDKGNFKMDNFLKVKAFLEAQKGEGGGGGGVTKEEEEKKKKMGAGAGAGGKRRSSAGAQKKQLGPQLDEELAKLIDMLRAKNMAPIIVFSFARRACEDFAMKLSGLGRGAKNNKQTVIDFNTPEEKGFIRTIVENAVACLPQEDQNLRAIHGIVPMLERGIAMHHSGLLPLLKEVIELLFQEGLIKCLFATETFAMGLNMPARTVIFSALTKWDGESTRFLESGEYTQMSGRAGRRGLDDRGMCVMLADNSLEEATCRSLLSGSSAPLYSSFKLSYYTLINLQRRLERGDRDMEFVIAQSFAQYLYEKNLPTMKAKVLELRHEASLIRSSGSKGEGDNDEKEKEKDEEEKKKEEELAREYVRVLGEAEAAKQRRLHEMLRPDRSIHLLSPGRIITVSHEKRNKDGQKEVIDLGYGVVISVLRVGEREGHEQDAAEHYVVDTLLCCSVRDSEGGLNGVNRSTIVKADVDDKESSMHVVPVPLPSIATIHTLRISLPSDLINPKNVDTVKRTLAEIVKRYPQGALPPMDLVVDCQVPEHVVRAEEEAVRKAEAILATCGTTNAEEELRRKAALLAEADAVEKQIRNSQLVHFQEESRNRVRVLQRLGHIDEGGMVTAKGKAASHIDTADELLCAELMFNGVFGSLDKHQLAALVSCLVAEESENSDVRLMHSLAMPLGQLQQTAMHIAEISNECKVEIEAGRFCDFPSFPSFF